LIILTYIILENAYIKDWLVDENMTEAEKRFYFSNKAFDIIIRMLSFASESKDEIETFLAKSHVLLNVVSKSDELEQRVEISRSKELIKGATDELQKYGRVFVTGEDAKKIASSLLYYKGGRSGNGRKKSFGHISQLILKERKDSVTVVTDITLKEEKNKPRKSYSTKYPKKEYDFVNYSRFPEKVSKNHQKLVSSSILAIDNKRQEEQSSTPSLSLKQTTVLKQQPVPTPTSSILSIDNKRQEEQSRTPSFSLKQTTVGKQQQPFETLTSSKKRTDIQETLRNSEPIQSNILSMHPSELLDSFSNIQSLAVELLQFGCFSSSNYEFENFSDMRYRYNELFSYRKYGNCAQCIRNNTVKSNTLTFPCIHLYCRVQAESIDNSFCCEHYEHELINGHCMFVVEKNRNLM
jgi:hypothetical protein